jgi:hypothetical protein
MGMQFRMSWRYDNSKYAWRFKQVVVTLYRELFQLSPGGTDKNHENPSG